MYLTIPIGKQYAPVSIDHIFSIKAFVDYGISDISLINCLENLQPISSYENISKNAKYNKQEFEVWLRRHGYLL